MRSRTPSTFVNNFAGINEELANELRDELDASAGKTVDEVRDDLYLILGDLKKNASVIRRRDAD